MTLLGPPPSASLFPSAAPAPQPRQAATVWNVLAIDPGPEQSAWVVYSPKRRIPLLAAKEANALVLDMIAKLCDPESNLPQIGDLVIEQIASMGMAVGNEVFETVFWSGRFCQKFGPVFHRVKRHEVKMHLCGNMRAKDPNIRQSLLDRFGGKDRAVGKKATPGPLYDIKNDMWSALAVAVTWADRKYGGVA